MKLSEYRFIIDCIHAKAIVANDKHALIMSPAEFFAYDAIRRIQEEIISRADREEQVIDSLMHPENDGYSEAEACLTCLLDLLEFIDAYLSCDDDVMDSILTPAEIDMYIEL